MVDINKLKNLLSQGKSQREIADVFGLGQSTIRYWLCKYKLGTTRVHRCRKCSESNPQKFTPGRWSCCRSCRGKYQTRKFRNYKVKAVAYKGGCCEVCGYKKCFAALDFHHVDPSQKDPRWKKMRNWTFDKVKTELDKCILVCRNCHAEIHYGA